MFLIAASTQIGFELTDEGVLRCCDLFQGSQLSFVRLICKKISAEFFSHVCSTSVLQVVFDHDCSITYPSRLDESLAKLQLFKYFEFRTSGNLDETFIESISYITDTTERELLACLKTLSKVDGVKGMEVSACFWHIQDDDSHKGHHRQMRLNWDQEMRDACDRKVLSWVDVLLKAGGIGVEIEGCDGHSHCTMKLGSGIITKHRYMYNTGFEQYQVLCEDT